MSLISDSMALYRGDTHCRGLMKLLLEQDQTINQEEKS